MGTSSMHLCNIGELPAEGRVREISVGNQTFCVAKLNGEVAVLDNECPHHGGPLGQGMVEDGKVVCPWHAYAFDVNTGSCDDEPKLRVRVYPVTVQGDDVTVAL
jgi:nitrite reductase (NADH) small subunit